MKSKICTMTTIGVAALMCASAQANPILPELIFALENNPQLLSSRYALSSAESRAQAADASRLPTVNISYDNGKEKINSLPATAKAFSLGVSSSAASHPKNVCSFVATPLEMPKSSTLKSHIGV